MNLQLKRLYKIMLGRYPGDDIVYIQQHKAGSAVIIEVFYKDILCSGTDERFSVEPERITLYPRREE